MSQAWLRWRRRLIVLGVLLLPVVGFLSYGWYKLFHEVPQEYVSDEWYFKYGSIGSEEQTGVPYLVWLVLPSERLVYVYTSWTQIKILTDADVLDAGEGVPGFQLAVKELFEEEGPPANGTGPG